MAIELVRLFSEGGGLETLRGHTTVRPDSPKQLAGRSLRAQINRMRPQYSVCRSNDGRARTQNFPGVETMRVPYSLLNSVVIGVGVLLLGISAIIYVIERA